MSAPTEQASHTPPEQKICTCLSTVKTNEQGDGEDPNVESKWTRHPDLYMEDGSVVLLAEDTLFRVYLRWLGKHSDVFLQMTSFSGVQPADAETYDGCPLVRLTDSAEDVGYFLNGMDGCSHYFCPNKPTAFRIVAGVLRMASKYMVAPLREKAINHFSRLYPVRFQDLNPDHKTLRRDVFGTASDAPAHPIILVNLFRSCNVTKLLPWAYYSVVRWSYRDMVTGHKQATGSIVRLSEPDMQLCLLGFETLLTTQHANIEHIFQGPVAKCANSSSCSEGIKDAYTRALYEHGTGLIAPLGPLRRKIIACERCVTSIRRMDEAKRKEVWEHLPGVFDLPTWAALLE